ncbi:MAG: hypothetical protein HZA50_07375 [Planctomycetes bacterium]|nr:hypothetical protein [Planctomycetota bacterium]
MDRLIKVVGIGWLFLILGSFFWKVMNGHNVDYGFIGIFLAFAIIGIAMCILDRITVIRSSLISIEAATKHATDAAKAIDELRTRIENQRDTIDNSFKQATKAAALADDLSQKVHDAENKLLELDGTLSSAKNSLDNIEKLNEFIKMVIFAQNDDRKALEKLEVWASDPNFPMQQQANQAYLSILEKHSAPKFGPVKYPLEFRNGIVPAKLTIADFIEFYPDQHVYNKLGITLQRNFLWHDAASQLIQLDAKSA